MDRVDSGERRDLAWDGDVVESSPDDAGWLARAWAGLSPARRRAVLVALAVIGCAAGIAWGVLAGRSWLEERSLADEVELSASMGVSSSSTTPAGGSVDFYLSIVNLGRRPVTITAVDITTGRFRITNGEIRIPTVQPTDTLLVPLSVLLDCTGSPDDRGGLDLPGVVAAVPESGRSRDVDVRVAAADVVTGIAETLCPMRPTLRDLELDGPVL